MCTWCETLPTRCTVLSWLTMAVCRSFYACNSPLSLPLAITRGSLRKAGHSPSLPSQSQSSVTDRQTRFVSTLAVSISLFFFLLFFLLYISFSLVNIYTRSTAYIKSVKFFKLIWSITIKNNLRFTAIRWCIFVVAIAHAYYYQVYNSWDQLVSCSSQERSWCLKAPSDTPRVEQQLSISSLLSIYSPRHSSLFCRAALQLSCVIAPVVFLQS